MISSKMSQKLDNTNKLSKDIENFHKTEMQREMVLQRLREKGCRITKQRQTLLNVILQEECASCKEIYYKAASVDSGIGTATVYRMVNLLEDIGAISRKGMYTISCSMNCNRDNACIIELDDCTVCQLSAKDWYKVISEGLKICGYVESQTVTNVMVTPCENDCNLREQR